MHKLNEMIFSYNENVSRFAAKVLVFLVPVSVLGLCIFFITTSGISFLEFFIIDDKRRILLLVVDIIAIFRAYPAPHKLVINSKGEVCFYRLLDNYKLDMKELLSVEIRKFLWMPTYIVFVFNNRTVKMYYSKEFKNDILKAGKYFHESLKF